MNQKILSRCVLLALSGLSAMTYAQETAVNTAENASSQSDSAITAGSATPPQQSIELQPITILGGEINGVDSTLPNVDVINVYTLRNPRVTNLREALSYNPAVELQALKGQAGQIFIRGMGNNYVNLMIDGEKVPDLYKYGPYMSSGRNFVEINTIRQIDIIKGLHSPKQRTGSMGGTVNLQTYAPKDFVDEAHPVYADAGLDYTSKNSGIGISGTLAGKQNNYSGMLIFTHRNHHELKNMGKVAKENVKQNDLLAKGELDVEKGTLFLTGEYFNRAQNIEQKSFDYATFSIVTKNYDQPASRKRLALEGEFAQIAGIDSVKAKLYGHSYSQTTRYPYSAKTDKIDYNQHGISASVDATKKIEFAAIPNNLLFGLGYDWNKYDTLIKDGWLSIPAKPIGNPFHPTGYTKKQTTSVPEMRFFPITNQHHVFAYLKDQLQLTNGLTIAPGLRIEYNYLSPTLDKAYNANPALVANTEKYVPKGGKVTISPSLNIAAPISDMATVFASYARGERSADMVNISSYDHGFGFFMPNPKLKTETSHNFELGLNYVIPQQLELKVSGFFSKYNNFIGMKDDGIFGFISTYDKIKNKWSTFPKGIQRPYNINEYKTYGLEIESAYRISEQFDAHINLGWMQGSLGNQTSHGLPLNQAYPAKAILGLSYHQGNTYGGDLKVTIAGQGQKPNPTQRNPKPFHTPGYTVADLTAWWKPIDNLTVTGGVYNLTNKKYWTIDTNGQSTEGMFGPVNMDDYTQPGRNFAVSVKYSY